MDSPNTQIAPRTSTGSDTSHEPLIASLRSELEEYGGLVALFDDQQAAILSRDAERCVVLAEELQRQVVATRVRRKEREALVAQLAPSAEGEKPAALADVLPLLRAPVRPLVEALKEEIFRLINQTRRRQQQNEALLSTLNSDGSIDGLGRRRRRSRKQAEAARSQN